MAASSARMFIASHAHNPCHHELLAISDSKYKEKQTLLAYAWGLLAVGIVLVLLLLR